MIRRTERSWSEFFDMRMREIDQNWKREMICAAIALPLMGIVAWLIAAL